MNLVLLPNYVTLTAMTSTPRDCRDSQTTRVFVIARLAGINAEFFDREDKPKQTKNRMAMRIERNPDRQRMLNSELNVQVCDATEA